MPHTPVLEIKRRSKNEKEKRESDKKKREKEDMNLYLEVKIITEDTFRVHQGFDLASFDDLTIPPTDSPRYKVAKQLTFLEFKSRLAEDLGYQIHQLRLWAIVNRHNKTSRVEKVVNEDDPTLTMQAVRTKMAFTPRDLKLYLEVLEPVPTTPLILNPEVGPLIIFLKYFDLTAQTLAGVCHFFVDRNQKVGDLVPRINRTMDFPGTTTLKLYEEIKPGMIDPLELSSTFLESEFQNGDIICFQIKLSDKHHEDMKRQHLYVNPPQFYDFLANRLMVYFKPRYDDMTLGTGGEFSLLLSKKTTYDVMARSVGERLGYDHTRLRFTNTLARKAATQSLVGDMTQPYYSNNPSNVLFYELLDIGADEFGVRQGSRFSWASAQPPDENSYLASVRSSITDVTDLLPASQRSSAIPIPSDRPKLLVIEEEPTEVPPAGEVTNEPMIDQTPPTTPATITINTHANTDDLTTEAQDSPSSITKTETIVKSNEPSAELSKSLDLSIEREGLSVDLQHPPTLSSAKSSSYYTSHPQTAPQPLVNEGHTNYNHYKELDLNTSVTNKVLRRNLEPEDFKKMFHPQPILTTVTTCPYNVVENGLALILEESTEWFRSHLASSEAEINEQAAHLHKLHSIMQNILSYRNSTTSSLTHQKDNQTLPSQNSS